MSEPWADVREWLNAENTRYVMPRTVTESENVENLLADADALLAVVRDRQEHYSNMPLILEGDSAIEVALWMMQGWDEALAALPEHLR